MRTFSDIDPNEIVTLTLDFTPDLQPGETLTGPVVMSVSVASGIDTAPASRLNGSAQISGALVLQSVKTCVSGTNYYVSAACTTSLSRVLSIGGRLDCVPAALQ